MAWSAACEVGAVTIALSCQPLAAGQAADHGLGNISVTSRGRADGKFLERAQR
jgi:hypothetical protein